MRAYLFILCLFISTLKSAEAVEEVGPVSRGLIQEILAMEAPEEGRSHVTFDIDDTLCEKEGSAYTKQAEILKRFPDSLVMPYKHPERGLFKFIFYPEMMEVFLTCLKWGWNVDFFSYGIEDRNTSVMRTYFTYMLGKYVENPKEVTEQLFTTRIRVFSRQHLKSGDEVPHGKYGTWGINKKDLTVLEVPLERNILVEDDRSYVVGGDQYPFLNALLPISQEEYYFKVNKGAYIRYYKDFSSFHEAFERGEGEEPLPAAEARFAKGDFAIYFAGVFKECFDLMQGEEGVSIRAALSEVLKKPEGWAPSEDPWDSETPWYLWGSHEKMPHEKYEGWLTKGRLAIDEIKKYRREDFEAPQAPFVSIGLDLYGQEFDPDQHGSDGCVLM